MAIEVIDQSELANSYLKEKAAVEPVPIVGSGEDKIEAAPKDPEVDAEGKRERKQPKPVQPRIDELTRKAKESDEFAQNEYNLRLAAEKRARDLEEQLARAKPVEAPKEDAEPKPEDFEDAIKYAKALTTWTVKQERKAWEAEQAQIRSREAENTRAREFRAAVEKLAEEIPDAIEVLEAAEFPAAGHILTAISESDQSARLAYHFATHPEELEKLNKLSPIKAIAAIGKLETQLEKKTEVKAETPEPKVNGSIERSKAPEPITPLRNASSPIEKDPGQRTFEEEKAIYLAEQARKRGVH